MRTDVYEKDLIGNIGRYSCISMSVSLFIPIFISFYIYMFCKLKIYCLITKTVEWMKYTTKRNKHKFEEMYTFQRSHRHNYKGSVKKQGRELMVIKLVNDRSFNFHLVYIWRCGQCTPFFKFAN